MYFIKYISWFMYWFQEVLFLWHARDTLLKVNTLFRFEFYFILPTYAQYLTIVSIYTYTYKINVNCNKMHDQYNVNFVWNLFDLRKCQWKQCCAIFE